MIGFSFYWYLQESVVLPAPPLSALYLNSDFDIEMRINDLLSYMTLEEKIGQMALVEKNSIIEVSDISSYNLGALLSGMGAGPEQNSAAGWKTMVTNFTQESNNSRLKIPILYGVDAIHGHGNVPGATIFPHTIGLGATGNEALVLEVARATALEVAATGINWTYSPTLDLPRDIRWGRTYETFSDDPELTSRLGRTYVKGVQSVTVESITSLPVVLATAKHYVGVGAMKWGSSSNKNFKIDQGTTIIDEQLLRTEYLPPFKAAIDAGVMSVMVGLNSYGDTKMSAESYLVTTVLKEELGFQGFTVSDWYAVYEMAGSDYDNAVSAINAGIDMVMLPFDYKPFIKNVSRAVACGEISEERIDDAVRRILRAKFFLGLFNEDKSIPELSVVGSTEHRVLARRAVAASLVLLKNEVRALPILPSVNHIRVAGSAADNIGRQAGAWTVEWQGIDGNWLPGATTILAGIKNRAKGAVVEYNMSGIFSSTTTVLADIGIVVVGEKPYAEGWGDTEFPSMSSEDVLAIKNMQSAANLVIVVIISGRPLLIADEIAGIDTLVAAWLPGSEGAGVADVLFGDVPFRGQLPLPWPYYAEQLPISASGTTSDGTPPLFPRYFGLQ